MSKPSRRNYTEEFKREAVKLTELRNTELAILSADHWIMIVRFLET